MKNKEIARIFERIADLLEILSADRFRINSYRKAARVVGDLTEAIEDIVAADKLQEIPGVGKSTAEKILQYLDTGKVEMYEELLDEMPGELPGMLEIPGLGPKTVAKLWRQADITSTAQLRDALEKNPETLEKVEGLGSKKAQSLLVSMKFMEGAAGRIRLGEADELAGALLEAVVESPNVGRAIAAGSLRRGMETIGDIDILCEASKSGAESVIADFTEAPAVRNVLARGKTKGSVILDGEVQADLRVVESKSFGAAMSYFTGSKAHNVRLRELAIRKGMKLSEYGLFAGDKQVAGKDEDGIYKALGMQFVPPELREDRGEVEVALKGKLPKILEMSDIRGDLHVHTVASDGANTIEEMASACQARGYKYMAVSDHSQSQIQAHGLDAKRLREQIKAIRATSKKFPEMMILASIEVDIFKDGTLDFESDVLAELDFVTASPHSALSMKRLDATKRLIKAIEHPCVHCIGHPSGRLINSRAGMELDIEAVAAAAAANNVALEVNAHYWRLDLRDTHIRAAINAGAKIIINTDAHEIAGLDMMKYGVTTARRGWATVGDVLNTYSARQLKKWLASCKAR